ncbi:MAG: DivIVA domain-containing protein [Eubacterium sp.]|nr:DivIVA domain-containing protein [Eubacterium sp.]
MSATEIILIVIGVAVFLLGYLMPARKKDIDEEVQLISEDEVRKMVAGEVEHVKERIDDIVEETVSYSMEKAERAMERLTNEKIMAVNEYSDTVLEEINKNHKEVVFLYDMLNDKHDNLMSAINEATVAADEIKQTVKDAEITANEAADRLDAVMQAIDEAEETVQDAENTAMRVEDASQRAMNTVIQAVESAKSSLAVIRSAGAYREETVQRAQERIPNEDITKVPEQGPEEMSAAMGRVETAREETWKENAESAVDEPESDMVMADEAPVVSGRVIHAAPDAEEETEDFKPISPRRVEIIHQPDGDYVAENAEEMSTSEAFANMGIFGPKTERAEVPVKKTRLRRSTRRDRVQENASGVDIQFAQGRDNGRNSNERILELHKAGKSNMAIAKELGLGLGEVKLVIDLFEGI